ncbi:DUF3372 domain-containing protein [Lysobacter solisilvae]|uniref:DUF3372 domain-containing protein n=2 Tax=Agrilutibacter solisilvae TaxID=2763317 RepID=A0A974Y211_9GAMM|nr:DUF3372 domain-containing protein [Lysobacter solisilvae]
MAAVLAATVPLPALAHPSSARADAADAAALRAACDAPGWAKTLHAAPHAAADARAYALDGRHLQWPDAPAQGRYRLHHSADAQLQARPGQAVSGADDSITLSLAKAPAAAAARLAFLAPGPVLSLPDGAPLARWLRGQLLLAREDAQGRVLDATHVQWPGALDDLHRAALEAPLGAEVTAASTQLGVWAPTARQVAACLHDTGAGASREVYTLRRDDASGTWSATLRGDQRGRYYTYLVDVYVPGVGVVRNRVTDPYSVSLTTDSRRSYLADLADPALAPPGWSDAPRPRPLAAATDMSIYELHVRDFSRDDPTVPAADRGRYRAFTHAGSAGMRHLRKLARAGLTDVHLLPVFDIATIPEAGCATPRVPAAAPDSASQQALVMAQAAHDCFNWGYDPYHYSAPEGSYASDAADGAVRIREFRAMVAALHASGLRVGMDVVYNHTTVAGQQARSVLDRIVPGYYHRLDAKGVVERSTCCDNTATEHAMMARLMADSVALWAAHHRIDSFRFDLMGHQPRAAMEQVQRRADAAAGRHVDLIGEGWNFGEVADGRRFVQASQRSLGGSGIGTFSDRMRDAARGGGCCDSGAALQAQGWLTGLHYAPNGHADATRSALLAGADLVRAGLAGTLRDYPLQTATGDVRPLSQLDYKGQPAGYATQPGEVVNYVENHDNPTLFDIGVLKLPRDTPREDRARVQLLGAALVAFSQGIAYFHAGMDLLRSKSLDRNSFDSGDWFNRIDWEGRDNFFGTGLPPAADNGKDWDLLRPALADAAAIRPTPADIAFMRDGFRDLLRIRRSSSLFRLRSAAEVEALLRFGNTGPAQNPVVIAGHLDGAGYPGANFREVLYLLNVSPQAQSLVLPEEKDKRYVLHPVLRGGADTRVRETKYDATNGKFVVPARAVVVYVVE